MGRQNVDQKDGKNISQEQFTRELSDWAHITNVNFIIEWHNITLQAYRSHLEWIDGEVMKKGLSDSDSKRTKAVMEGYMERKLKNTCLVMHLSNFEEISYLICKQEKAEMANSSSIRRFMKGWRKRTGMPQPLMEAWETIVSAEKVRNCILHAYERVSLVRQSDRPHLELILKREGIQCQNDRIAVGEDYLNKVKNAIITMIQGVQTSCGTNGVSQ